MNMAELFKFVNPEQARLLQTELSTRVIQAADSGFKPRLFCGLDVSYLEKSAVVAASVWDSKLREFVESIHASMKTTVEYMPGLLGFREGPLIVELSQRLRSSPDVFLVDGQGVAHPRRFGLACHFGVAIDKPVVGVAKSRLYGKIDKDSVLDSEGAEIGRVITNSRGKRFFVSVGNRISLEAAATVVTTTLVDGHPAPLRKAHLDSIRFKGGSLN
jgi:deoxyribonuclease V